MKKILQCFLIISTILLCNGCNSNSASSKQIDSSYLLTTYKEKPVSARPKSQDPMDNIFIALNTLKQASYYQSESTGEVIAKKAIKLATQSVSSRRIITPQATFSESISVSSFVKVAEQLYVTDDKILKRDASKVSSSNVTWQNSKTTLSTETYNQEYGYSISDPSRYIINEKTITSEIEIVNNGIGRKYSYKFSLDPEIAPYYYSKSVQSLSGSSSSPTFKSIEMTLTFDYKWRITKIEVNETYEINMPALGKVTCNATLTETFKNIGKVLTIDEEAFFTK